MQVGEKRAERVQPHAPLQAKGIERGNNQARLPPVALCSCPQPGLRMDVPMPHSLLETMCPALGHSRVLSTVAHTLRACLTKRVENPNTFLPKSHVGPVLQRGAELSPACSSSKYMTDTQLSRLRPLPVRCILRLTVLLRLFCPLWRSQAWTDAHAHSATSRGRSGAHVHEAQSQSHAARDKHPGPLGGGHRVRAQGNRDTLLPHAAEVGRSATCHH